MALDSTRERIQRKTCERYAAEYIRTIGTDILGIADNVQSGILPINGLRHPPVGNTSGWYIWAGEKLSDEPDFFKPWHASHILELCPQVEAYLGLGPGWRFLIAGDYEDVWFDDSLLNPR